MTKAKTPPNLQPFDAARYLDNDDVIAEYMAAVLETEDSNLLLLALGDIARAKGMAQFVAVLERAVQFGPWHAWLLKPFSKQVTQYRLNAAVQRIPLIQRFR